MKKINVNYVKTDDPYKKLWDMSKADLIDIIKENDKTIDRLNKIH